MQRRCGTKSEPAGSERSSLPRSTAPYNWQEEIHFVILWSSEMFAPSERDDSRIPCSTEQKHGAWLSWACFMPVEIQRFGDREYDNSVAATRQTPCFACGQQ